jgi:hypothetical protein
VHVGAVDAGRADAHEHLAAVRLGVRVLLDEDLAVPDGRGAHRARQVSAHSPTGRVPIMRICTSPAQAVARQVRYSVMAAGKSR